VPLGKGSVSAVMGSSAHSGPGSSAHTVASEEICDLGKVKLKRPLLQLTVSFPWMLTEEPLPLCFLTRELEESQGEAIFLTSSS
jgi:hypothetical protein